ncbi:MAG: hypothetical protein KC917_00835 [Candidatus Omnitrophica bacterium]|nr:hypothetical protein [Candidatus Omnitrophota bacterium]MCB9783927.1 hypothetical protein [Candidatus Omnitrophota bacterium]
MIDIGAINDHLRPGDAKNLIDDIQVLGKKLTHRIQGMFTLVGHKAIDLQAENGNHYHALSHNEADDETEYVVVHMVGDAKHLFDSMTLQELVITNYLDRDHYDTILETVTRDILAATNEAFIKFVEKNHGFTPEPLKEEDLDMDTYARELAGRDLSFSHEGNMRLAF